MPGVGTFAVGGVIAMCGLWMGYILNIKNIDAA
jgi:hypothetical protein